MNRPKPNPNVARVRELASAVMDSAATEAERQELSDLLRTDREAQDEYLAYVDMHAIMATEWVPDKVEAVNPHSAKAPTKATPQPQAPVPTTRPKRLAGWVAALAACLLVAWTLVATRESDAAPQSFATLAQVTQAVWESEQIDLGKRIGPTNLRLRSGHVRLEFDSGVEVSLEGPADYQLIDATITELKSGLLTANVPPGAEGFTVHTPAAEVIDLGTSFGIDLRQEGFSNVSVFDGEVEVAVRDAAKKQLLTEGESVRIGADQEIEKISFDPKPFRKLWPIASGIAGSSENIQITPPWPRRFRFIQSDEDLFVALESHGFPLHRDMKVNLSQPGTYSRSDELTPATLERGKRVRTYMLHYAPQTQMGPRRARRVEGSLTFDRPVLGVITNHDELLASNRRPAKRGTGEGNHRRELNLTGDSLGDRITLSEDKKTIHFDLISPGRSADLIRIVVDGGGKRPRKRRHRL